jgi:hypothetical protein
VPYKKILLESPKLKSSDIFKAIEIAIPSTEIEAAIPEWVTRELGGRADNGLGSYTSLIKVAFMGGFTG